jgi:predicted glycoside hydrolase/deacetylase ChbG (UPF0249 family)
MANEVAFDEAVDLAKANGFADRVGVHLNLCHGQPVTDVPTRLRRPDGTLAFPLRRVWAPADDLACLARELAAQVQRVISAGIQPTHFDSHEHWVNSFPHTRVVLEIASTAGVHWLRPARNWLYRRSPVKSAFKLLYNGYLGVKGVRGVARFTDCKDFLAYRERGGGFPRGGVELMCHPAASMQDGGEAGRTESDLLMSAGFRESWGDAELVSYGQLPQS